MVASAAASGSAAGVATIKEKESVANLFCKLANLLRLRQTAFGSDARQAVKCLQVKKWFLSPLVFFALSTAISH